jgi:hypothetical protein
MFKKPVTQVLVSVVVALLVGVLFVTGCVSPPETVTAPPAKPAPPEEAPAKQIVEDLAYIKIMASGYSDDADPEDDGIAIDIMYYDSKSQHIDFKNIPLEVGIEIYGYGDVWDTFDHDKMELICTTQATIDHSMKLSEMFGEYMRIPFENISVNRSKYYEFGTVKVVVVTVKQGNFEAIEDGVRLNAKE